MTTDQPSDDQPSGPGNDDRPMFGPTPAERARLTRESERTRKKLQQIARDMAQIADDLAI